VTWVPFIELKGSAVLDEYDEAMGIRDKKKNGMHGPELGMSPIRVEGQSEWGKVKAETGGSDLDDHASPSSPILLSLLTHWETGASLRQCCVVKGSL
jgi:hypothetical protein